MLLRTKMGGKTLELTTVIKLRNLDDLFQNSRVPVSQTAMAICWTTPLLCTVLLRVVFISQEITPSSPREGKTLVFPMGVTLTTSACVRTEVCRVPALQVMLDGEVKCRKKNLRSQNSLSVFSK